MRKCFFILFLLNFSGVALAQQFQCYPTHWWTGMQWNKVQLMIYSNSDRTAWTDKSIITINYPGVKIKKIQRVENVKYLFLDLEITPGAKPGKVKIDIGLIQNKDFFSIDFELKSRRTGNGKDFAKGVTSKDFIYLIMPDRFSNGDESNDKVPGMRDQSLNRDTVFNRHGGDLKGIQNHLGYLKSLGVTALWLNPVIENDMDNRTEHGYAFTNHYKVDPRLGGDQAYHELIDAAHKKGMKIIQDAVYNHVGIKHFTVLDPPMKDWLHQWPNFTQTSYKEQVLFDPYASKADIKTMSDGWFVSQMPDLNQNNSFVANYLIQHAIWTVEEYGIDGWRIDTYAYNDLEFMNHCNKALMNEYPKLTLFGETWVHGVPNQSYFAENNFKLSYKSNLQAVTDFQTLWGITDALTKDFGWTDGVNKLYTILAQDFVYKDPMQNVVFLDNHDIARFFSVVGENVSKYKSAICWLLTCRGIPQFYYGGEIGLTGFTSPNDGYVRQDFPGGWITDTVNKFTAEGRNARETEIWNHVSVLANYRKNSAAITNGKMMQFVPQDGVYVYFRYDEKQTVMIVMNTAKENKNVALKRYDERTKGFSKMKNIITGEITDLKNFDLPSYESKVFELLN